MLSLSNIRSVPLPHRGFFGDVFYDKEANGDHHQIPNHLSNIHLQYPVL
jgi:hypothetical protein